MRNINLTKAAFVGLSLYLSQAQASPTDFDYCVDHSTKYALQKFISIGSGDLGKMRLIDMDTRQITDLFCGFDRDENKAIEIACVSSHSDNGTSTQTIRVRVHRKMRKDLPRIALMEIENGDSAGEGINRVIPMICNTDTDLKETL